MCGHEFAFKEHSKHQVVGYMSDGHVPQVRVSLKDASARREVDRVDRPECKLQNALEVASHRNSIPGAPIKLYRW
jgi:hypothetical protein